MQQAAQAASSDSASEAGAEETRGPSRTLQARIAGPIACAMRFLVCPFGAGRYNSRNRSRTPNNRAAGFIPAGDAPLGHPPGQARRLALHSRVFDLFSP